MSLNCIEIEEVIKTAPKSPVLSVKKFYQTDKNTLVINILTQNKDLYLIGSVNDRYNRIFFASPDNSFKYDLNTSMRFTQFLNTNLAGAKIIKIYQHDFSRIVVIELKIKEKIFKIIFRLWGTGGNILLSDENNAIIESLRRLPKRGEWPREIFKLPENTPEKIDENKKRFNLRDEFKNKDINKAIEEFYHDIINRNMLYSKKDEIMILLENEIKILKKNLEKINENISIDREEKYRHFGELLKMNIYKIKKGIHELEVFDHETGSNIIIPLERNLSPSANIEKYFEKYKKIKKGKASWEKEALKTKEKLLKYENFHADALKIDDAADLLDLAGEIKGSKITRQVNKSKKKTFARIFLLSDDYTAYVSKNAKDADMMLKNNASGNDYWFHIRDYEGSHVVVKNKKGLTITDNARLEAALLAMHFSKAKKASEADIYFTNVKYLHKPNQGKPGLVFPFKEKNIKIKFDENILNRIFSRKVV
jgi:predicted ribosome quality control (RQC) complex YloA/Tae2 family protein